MQQVGGGCGQESESRLGWTWENRNPQKGILSPAKCLLCPTCSDVPGTAPQQRCPSFNLPVQPMYQRT